MAIRGDTLYVTDINTIRYFNRLTGQPLGSIPVEGATFLNDIAVGPDETVYFTDSGLNPDFSPSGTHAIYRIEGEDSVALVSDAVMSPNGITLDEEGKLYTVSFGPDGNIIQLGEAPEDTIATLPGGSLDGLVRLPDGQFLISSWEDSTVYLVDRSNQVSPVLEQVESPADIGYDPNLNRLLVPLFNQDKIIIYPLEGIYNMR